MKKPAGFPADGDREYIRGACACRTYQRKAGVENGCLRNRYDLLNFHFSLAEAFEDI
jgi:hypothetical protein